MAWQDQYTRAENRLGTPTGRVSARPFPGGQKIGRTPVINNTPFSGQSNSKIVSIASYNGSSVTSGSGTAVVDIKTPSSRLTCGIQIFVERNGILSELPVLPGAVVCSATLLAMGVNPLTGYQTPLQALAAFNPPFSFQVDPAFRAVRLAVTIDYRNWVYSSSFTTGVLKVLATWEPNVDMASDELNRLQQLCSMVAGEIISA